MTGNIGIKGGNMSFGKQLISELEYKNYGIFFYNVIENPTGPADYHIIYVDRDRLKSVRACFAISKEFPCNIDVSEAGGLTVSNRNSRIILIILEAPLSKETIFHEVFHAAHRTMGLMDSVINDSTAEIAAGYAGRLGSAITGMMDEYYKQKTEEEC
jgi:hypothetical protein